MTVTQADSKLVPIIIRLPNWVGDVCMTFPSLSALADTGLPLIVCGRPWSKDLVAQFSPDQFVSLTGKFLMDRQAISAIPKHIRRASVGLLLPDSLSSAALFALAGIKSAGYRDDGRSLLLRWPINKSSQAAHAVEKWWRLTQEAVNAWGLSEPATDEPEIPPEPKTVSLTISEDAQTAALAAIHRVGLKPHRFILLAPTATGTHHGKIKVWPHFEQLAQQLKSQGLEVATCPPAHERGQAQQACPTAVLVDPLPLTSFCALTRLASLVVCNDSGVSHMAALAGANQLTLFGVTDPAKTRPWSEKAITLGSNGHWPSEGSVLEKLQQTLAQEDQPQR
jgi:heptosyltransferase-2